MEAIDTLIQSRRSFFVKEFTGNILTHELISRMLKNADTAPNHKLTKPWRFTIFEGENKNELCHKMEEYYLEFTPSEKFRQDKLDKIRTYAAKVSHIISIGMHPSGMVPEWEELAATAMAVQNMYLTLAQEPHAAGYWTSGNGTGSDFMKSATGLTSEDKQLGFFLLGYVEEKHRTL
ncbi:MAG: nitroreductase family protein [Bacteroidia bacterium]|jgi:nitroreductase